MSLKDQALIDENVFFNTADFGEQVTFTPTTGTARTIVVVFSFGGNLEGKKGQHVVSAQAAVRVKKSDFPDDKPKGKITRSNGDVWKFGQEISSNFLSRRLEISTDSRALF